MSKKNTFQDGLLGPPWVKKNDDLLRRSVGTAVDSDNDYCFRKVSWDPLGNKKRSLFKKVSWDSCG